MMTYGNGEGERATRWHREIMGALERIAAALEALAPEPDPEPTYDCGDCFGPLYRCTREPEHNGCHEYAVAGKVLTSWP